MRFARTEPADCPVGYMGQSKRVTCRSNVPDTWKSGEKELQLVLFSSRFCCTSCAITQSERSRHLKRPSPYTITNARRVGCNNAPKCTAHPSCFDIFSYLSTWNYFVESIISHEMHCQLCWIVASMVLLDSKNIADAIVCAYKELLRNMSE